MKFIRRFSGLSHVSMGFEEKEKLFRIQLKGIVKECALRYVKFNVEGAQEMACRALGASRCTHFAKLMEGSYNKIFELKFDNGAEAILRIPCPVGGPPHWSTASEVATLEFVRQELGIPAPRALSWSSRANSPDNYLGTEYILMEKINGVDAITRWNSIQKAEASPLIKGLYGIDQKLGSLRFSCIGSLYFKEDVEGLPNARSLFSADAEVKEHLKQVGERYRIGPLADRHWWRGDRIEMSLDYGPCMFSSVLHDKRYVTSIYVGDGMASFLTASARNERIWIKYSRLRNGIRQRSLQPKEPEVHYRILELYETVVPYITPKYPFAEPILWHPDISLSNILVPNQGPASIAALIDWQGAFTGPYCSQAVFPAAFAYLGGLIDLGPGVRPPQLPADFESRPEKEQKKLRLHLKFAMRHKYYMFLMSRDPLRLAASQLPHMVALAMLPYWAVRSWSDGWTRMIGKWDTTLLDGQPCPIEFSKEEFRAISKRSDLYNAAVEALNTRLDAGGDGWVPNDHYQIAIGLLERARASWDETESGGPLPYEDGREANTVVGHQKLFQSESDTGKKDLSTDTSTAVALILQRLADSGSVSHTKLHNPLALFDRRRLNFQSQPVGFQTVRGLKPDPPINAANSVQLDI
ncbi:hypothetical protein Clacol_008326 [Clathrus columnatus]|uniref:Altered inheritance of mitochondria protein 9, mitochondrial n=1 Tax=Clathrus columnatus TaxID=1419009 RepID=A0AAV5AHG7_9AGAM|nr:hypothetical protein Clacol_008326 [Clathrus columnatus]